MKIIMLIIMIQLKSGVFSMVLVVDSQTTTAFLVFFLFHLFLCWLSFLCFGFSFFRLLITAFFKFLNLCKCIRFCYGFTSHNRTNISIHVPTIETENEEFSFDDSVEDNEPCCICGVVEPATLKTQSYIEFVNWAQCHLCKHWVHR
jgi:hypothetical protein